MSESIKSITCPHCGGTLELQDGLDTFFCLYCGGKVTLTGLSDAAYDAKVKIKEMEHQERIKDKEYEFKKYQNKDSRKTTTRALLILIGVFLASFLYFLSMKTESDKAITQLTQIESELEQAIANEDYDLALIKANQLRYNADWSADEKRSWDEKREFYIQLIISKQESNGTS